MIDVISFYPKIGDPITIPYDHIIADDDTSVWRCFHEFLSREQFGEFVTAVVPDRFFKDISPSMRKVEFADPDLRMPSDDNLIKFNDGSAVISTYLSKSNRVIHIISHSDMRRLLWKK